MRDTCCPVVFGMRPGLAWAYALALTVAVWAMPAHGAAASTPQATPAAPAASDPVLEARMMALATELRCLVCQNQTIADSNAGLALDLRAQIREMLQAGRSEREILDYMTQRYGDFVLYRPPLKSTTALLWAGPALLLLGGLAGLWWVLRRRQALGDEAFETAPDGIDDDAAPMAASPGGPPPNPMRNR